MSAILRLQRPLVTRERFFVAFQPVEQPAFLQVGNRQRIIRRNRPVVTTQRVLIPAQQFQRGTFLDQRLCVIRVQVQDVVETFQGLRRLIETEQRLAFGEQQRNLVGVCGCVVGGMVAVGGRGCGR